jgi:hypothetical protein
VLTFAREQEDGVDERFVKSRGRKERSGKRASDEEKNDMTRWVSRQKMEFGFGSFLLAYALIPPLSHPVFKDQTECITICMPESSSIHIVTSSVNNQQQYHEKRIKRL